MKKKYQYPTVIQSIASIRNDLKDFADLSEIPESELRQITLVVEELFSKIVRFAFEGKEQQLLEISLSKADREITLEIMDEGDEFNPLETNPEQLMDPASIDEGGMGLSLIMAFCDSINYSREEKKNILLIKKIIRGQAETEAQ
jgi:serine/threonine-protein kinase RsbW